MHYPIAFERCDAPLPEQLAINNYRVSPKLRNRDTHRPGILGGLRTASFHRTSI